MDIYCTTCGEPRDVLSLHDAVDEATPRTIRMPA